MHVPAGWASDGPGYWTDYATGTEIAVALRTTRLERDAWEEAYNSLKTKTDAHSTFLDGKLKELSESLNAERESFRSDIRRAKGPGFGVFAGAGYSGGGVEAVVGVGLVWKVF